MAEMITGAVIAIVCIFLGVVLAVVVAQATRGGDTDG